MDPILVGGLAVIGGVLLALLLHRLAPWSPAEQPPDDPRAEQLALDIYKREIDAELVRAEERARAAETRCAAAVELATEEERKRREQFVLIEGIQRERDGWKNELLRCGRGYSVGQALLMQEIQRLARIAKRPVKKEVTEFSEKFSEEFGAAGMALIEARIDTGGEGKSSAAVESVAKGESNA